MLKCLGQIVTGLCVIVLCYAAIAQERPFEPVIVEADGGECEQNSMRIGQLRRKVLEEGRTLIIIAHLGDNEQSRDLNRRRLHNAKVALDLENVVMAEGEKVKGKGRVNFYLDGRLYLVSQVKTGKDLCVTCCDPDSDLYPWYKQRRPKREK